MGRTDTVLHVPDSVLVIKQAVCRYYPITKLELPASVLYIEDYAFQYCQSLEEVTVYEATLPSTIPIFISSYAYGIHSFGYCSSLKKIEFLVMTL
jgi:hypothetical protein